MSWIDLLLPDTTPFKSDGLPHFRQPLDLSDLREWGVQLDSLDEARKLCPRGDWRLFLERRTAGNVEEVRRVVAAAAACARWILPFGPRDDLRPARAVELAERWAEDGNGTELLAAAAQAASDASETLDDRVHYAEVLVCAAAAAACNLALIPLPDDLRMLPLMIENCYPISAYTWAKAHAAADPLCGKIPSEEHRRIYAEAEAKAHKEARAALDSIIARYFP